MLHVTQVLTFLTHADADVRDHASKYFVDLGDASPAATADELWKAIDLFGDLPTEIETKERQRFLHALQEVPMNEASITRAIQMLDTCGSDSDCLFVVSRIFQKMPIEMLKQRQAEILPLPLSPAYRTILENRLALETQDAQRIWTQLVDLSSRADKDEKFDSNDAKNMVDALARHPDISIPLAMGVLEDPQDRWRLEIWCCDLLGHLRHAPAIDLLAQKIETEDADYLRQSAAEALGRMPAEIVVPRMETAYVSDDPFYRMVVADVLGHVKDPLAEAALLRLYPTEDSQTGMTGIAIALCELCTTEGLEQLRQVVIDNRYDTQIADIKELFVTVAKMAGYAPPELEEWTRQLKDPVYKEKLRNKFLSSFGMDEKMIDQFRSYLAGKPIEEPEEEPIGMPRSLAAPSTIRRTEPKIGRNDPCPCGSGKKYKKCCGK